jgi:hypothetical protein
MNEVRLTLDEAPIRFTPRGKVSVIDVIEALGFPGDARTIWRELAENHTDLVQHCDRYRFSKDEAETVIDNEGWHRLQDMLFDRMVEELL